jgi:NAD(P)-dependent dehydrogenase (short-subunit alcohol dehydrogenase family)
MPGEQRLQAKVALITGAASGIGLACAQRYKQEGATVCGADLNASENPVFDHFQVLDVRDGQAQSDWVAAITDQFDAIDIIVTAAGIGDAGPLHLVEEEGWDRVIDINLKGTMLSVKAVLPQMMAQRSGSIITVASVEGLEGCEGGSSYNASKGAVVLLTKNVAIDYARMGIRCNAICPGFIDTPLLRSVMDMEGMEDFRASVQAQPLVIPTGWWR